MGELSIFWGVPKFIWNCLFPKGTTLIKIWRKILRGNGDDIHFRMVKYFSDGSHLYQIINSYDGCIESGCWFGFYVCKMCAMDDEIVWLG
jgi:hypothetical protein